MPAPGPPCALIYLPLCGGASSTEQSHGPSHPPEGCRRVQALHRAAGPDSVPCTPASPAPQHPLRSTTGKRGVQPLGLQRLANFVKNGEKATQFCRVASGPDRKSPLPRRKGSGSGSAGLAPPAAVRAMGTRSRRTFWGWIPPKWGRTGGTAVARAGSRHPGRGHPLGTEPVAMTPGSVPLLRESTALTGRASGASECTDGPAQGWVLHGWGFGAGMGTQGRTPGPGCQGYLLARWKASCASSAQT